jgi:guanylate kinase
MRKGCFVVYLDIDRGVRESRLLGRQDKNDSITRRLDADDIDFQSYNDYDLKITDPEFSSDDVYDLMD